MKIVIFLDKLRASVNREARIEKLPSGRYHVVNMNMPYMGTINEIWSESELLRRLKNKEIELK